MFKINYLTINIIQISDEENPNTWQVKRFCKLHFSSVSIKGQGSKYAIIVTKMEKMKPCSGWAVTPHSLMH